MRQWHRVAAWTAALALSAAVTLPGVRACAQDACPGGYAGCASAPIAYHYREGLPVEFHFDTGWVPGGSPVQVRFVAALEGHTAVDLTGRLQAGWPVPMALRAVGDPGGGMLSVDYGIQFDARVRLHLPAVVGTIDWEGPIPYLPMIDFRAMATQPFDPWAWDPVMAHAMTMRLHIADIPLTDAIIHIPGISGGLTFDATGDMAATYHSRDITFGLAADPITQAMPTVQGAFTAGPFVEYDPRLEGTLDQTGTLHIHPGLYVSLAGRRWMIDLVDVPIPIGPFHQDIRFDPSHAHLGLPLLSTETTDLDFGDVTVGATSTQALYVSNHGEAPGRFLGFTSDGPFSVNGRDTPLPESSRAGLVASFAPVRPGPVDADLTLLTNDPTSPQLHVHVRGNGLPAPFDPDAGAATDDGGADGSAGPDGSLTGSTGDNGCGCTVPGRNHRGDPGQEGVMALCAVVVSAGFSAGTRARRRGRRPG